MSTTHTYNIISRNYNLKYFYKIINYNNHSKKYCYDFNHNLIYIFTIKNNNIIDAKIYPHIFYSINNRNLSIQDNLKYGTVFCNEYYHLIKSYNGLLHYNIFKYPNIRFKFYYKYKSYNIGGTEYLIETLYSKENNMLIKLNSKKYINNELFSYKLYNPQNGLKTITYY